MSNQKIFLIWQTSQFENLSDWASKPIRKFMLFCVHYRSYHAKQTPEFCWVTTWGYVWVLGFLLGPIRGGNKPDLSIRSGNTTLRVGLLPLWREYSSWGGNTAIGVGIQPLGVGTQPPPLGVEFLSNFEGIHPFLLKFCHFPLSLQ